MAGLRRWRWVIALAVVAVGALVLAATLDLPAEAFAVTPMALYAMVWVFFRQLDAPAPPRPPRPPRRPERPRPPPPAAPGARRRAGVSRRPVAAALTDG